MAIIEAVATMEAANREAQILVIMAALGLCRADAEFVCAMERGETGENGVQFEPIEDDNGNHRNSRPGENLR